MSKSFAIPPKNVIELKIFLYTEFPINLNELILAEFKTHKSL